MKALYPLSVELILRWVWVSILVLSLASYIALGK